MNRQDEDADAEQHDKCGQDDRLTVLREHGFAGAVLIEQAFDDEDGIVVSLAEDEGSEDDIDDVKLDSEELHERQYPDPAERHRNEGYERQGNLAKRKPEEDEDDERATEADVIEVLREAFGEVVEVEGIRDLRIRVQERIVEGLEGFRAETCFGGLGLNKRDKGLGVMRLPIGKPFTI